ncbi:hypothetical protein SUGI_0869040 [Cryptomeria japonica]|nr:hypothetical protein SUGI_0869040 [Cryptomeria japonica]
MNAIVKLKIAPLYLFYGPRGTGKTSAARIFASALNCSSPNRKSKPCCECSECCLCLSGKNPHIVELNVAGSDASEKLKLCFESVKSNNVTSGYRVFIIKDCHELSPEAWNNEILKCMENATDYVVFILITVDLELVPKAAISRCQKFYFQKLRDADMFNMLENIAVAEKINIEDKALHLITERAGGSLRDAEIALEQISLLSSTVTISRVCRTIGLLPDEKLLHLLEFALSGDKENTVRCTREIIDCGVEPLTLVTQLATLVKDALINSCLSTEAQENQYLFGMLYSSINRTEKLGRALKILSEVEKQLRVSNKCISWLTAVLLLFVSVELNSNSHSIVDIEIDEKDSAYEDKKTCHYTDQWNQKTRSQSNEPMQNGGDMAKRAEKYGQGQAKLVSLLVCKGAIGHVEFQNYQENSKMESLETSISKALEEALGCPVELRIILDHLRLENNSSEEGTNVISCNLEDALYRQESKLNSCKSSLMRCIQVLAGKHIKWNKRRNLGFNPFNFMPCPNSSCICVSVWNVNAGCHL